MGDKSREMRRGVEFWSDISIAHYLNLSVEHTSNEDRVTCRLSH